MQFKFNHDVQCKVDDAIASVEKHDVGRAQNILTEGMRLFENRNKHIKLTDMSEGGWATIDKYLENDMADNSDDDRRIRRAAGAARASCKRKRENALS